MSTIVDNFSTFKIPNCLHMLLILISAFNLSDTEFKEFEPRLNFKRRL